MKKKYSKELLIGLTVLITLLIIFFGIDYLKGINVFKAANYYYASYTNVAGLAQSAPVTVNGYKVGLVRQIDYEYDNPGHVKVEMSLDRKLRLPQGTKAVLVTDMLGTASIQLDMATSDSYHNVGDKLIGVNPTSLMDNVTNDIMPSVIKTFPKVDSLLTAINALVADPSTVAAIKRLDDVMANLQRATAALSTTLASTPAITTNVATTMKDVKEIAANLNTITGKLATTIENAPLDSTINSLNTITASLAEVTATLNTTQSSLGMLINDPQLYNNLTGATAALDSLLIDVKKNPKRYISIKLL